VILRKDNLDLRAVMAGVQHPLRLAGYEPVPTIYVPSGDVKWSEADPTYSVEAARGVHG
jgi:hypothetical protein